MKPLMPVLVVVAIALISAQAGVKPLRAGVVAASAGTHVLAMPGAPLTAGSAVIVVGIDNPQQAVYATILKRLEVSSVMTQHQVPGPFYELLAEHAMTLPDIGIALAGLATAERAGDTLIVHLGNPPVDVRARSCASSEGLHLTLWSGAPLKSRRLWHAYYYLGYDVAPTCTPADYAERD